MQHGFEEPGKNEVRYVGREFCLERQSDTSSSESGLGGEPG